MVVIDSNYDKEHDCFCLMFEVAVCLGAVALVSSIHLSSIKKVNSKFI